MTDSKIEQLAQTTLHTKIVHHLDVAHCDVMAAINNLFAAQRDIRHHAIVKAQARDAQQRLTLAANRLAACMKDIDGAE